MVLLHAIRCRLWVATSVVLMVLAGCGGGGDDGGARCGRVDGVWDVLLHFSNGMEASQQWTITQAGCDLKLSGDLADACGVMSTSANGIAGEGGFWASWTSSNSGCRCTSRVDAGVSGNTLEGTIVWTRSAYGAGDCVGAGFGSDAVSGIRR